MAFSINVVQDRTLAYITGGNGALAGRLTTETNAGILTIVVNPDAADAILIGISGSVLTKVYPGGQHGPLHYADPSTLSITNGSGVDCTWSLHRYT